MSGSVQSQPAPVRIDLEDGGVLQVTLARPEKRNALTWETFELLDEAFGRRAHQADVPATVQRWGGPEGGGRRGRLDDGARGGRAGAAAAAPLAVAAAKQLMLRDPAGIDGAASQRGALEANTSRLLGSGDFREGLNAMMERRGPPFRGVEGRGGRASGQGGPWARPARPSSGAVGRGGGARGPSRAAAGR